MYLKFGPTEISFSCLLPQITEIFKKKFEVVESKKNTPGLISVFPLHTPPFEVQKQFFWERSQPLYGEIKNNFFYLSDGLSYAELHYKSKTLNFWVHPKSLDDYTFFSRSFLLIPLLELLRTDGFYYIHGAVFEHNQQNILLLAKANMGKSTLAFNAITQNKKFVCDDNGLLFIENHRYKIIPFEQELRFNAEFKTSHPSHRYPNDPKVSVPSITYPQFQKQGVFIDTFLLLQSREAKPTSEADKSEVLKFLLEENPMLLTYEPLKKAHLGTLMSFISNVPGFNIGLQRFSNPHEAHLVF